MGPKFVLSFFAGAEVVSPIPYRAREEKLSDGRARLLLSSSLALLCSGLAMRCDAMRCDAMMRLFFTNPNQPPAERRRQGVSSNTVRR